MSWNHSIDNHSIEMQMLRNETEIHTDVFVLSRPITYVLFISIDYHHYIFIIYCDYKS